MLNPFLSTNAAPLSEAYKSSSPFPHMVFENFLDPTLMREAAVESQRLTYDYLKSDVEGYDEHENQFQKFGVCVDELPPLLKLISFYINQKEFLTFVRGVTGKPSLVGDPSYAGGGFHFTKRGGKLGIHHDFNFKGNPEQPESYRKCNLIIFLNDRWEDEWGGGLELWDKDLTRMHHYITPCLNKAVLFNIEDAPHGHPHPLQCPPNECRRSLAYYFYDDIPVNNRLYYRAHWKEGDQLV